MTARTDPRRRWVMPVVLALLITVSAPPRRASSFEPVSRRAQARAATSPAVVVAAGDIACDPGSSLFEGGAGTRDWCRARATFRLIRAIDPDVVIPLGDVQYDDGRIAKFRDSYALSWGKVRWRSRPVVGNHEYGVAGAAGYFRYFGARAGTAGRGWYSYDLQGWHIVSLNSNCELVGCRVGSPQYRWLEADLANPAACTLVAFHHPRFSSGPHGDDVEAGWTRDLWRLLYARGADIVLNGHDHIYERFAPMTPAGDVDRVTGIREFVVGTGGAAHYWIDQVRWASQVREARTFGVLRLKLHASSYGWRFVPIAGSTFGDSGFGRCHDARI